METIKSEFGNEIEFVKAVERLQRNYHPFDNKFAETLHQLEVIIKLQAILTNISLLVETANSKYRIHLEKLGAEAILSKLGISLPTENLYIYLKDQEAHTSVVEKIRYQIAIAIDSLPTEEPLLATRLRSEAIKRAKNVATSHVYNHQLPEIVLLYLDFSGLRTIPEPKESVISRYYEVVERNWQKRDGIKLYGGKGGDDAFSILFTSVQPALQCAKDIKREFSENLFLRSSGDIKFGLCYTIFQDHQKESEIIQCWGTSKDCCEFKSQDYRNRGHLLASEDTIRNLQLRENQSSLSQFMPMEGIYLKGEPESRIYYFNEIEPL